MGVVSQAWDARSQRGTWEVLGVAKWLSQTSIDSGLIFELRPDFS